MQCKSNVSQCNMPNDICLLSNMSLHVFSHPNRQYHWKSWSKLFNNYPTIITYPTTSTRSLISDFFGAWAHGNPLLSNIKTTWKRHVFIMWFHWNRISISIIVGEKNIDSLQRYLVTLLNAIFNWTITTYIIIY